MNLCFATNNQNKLREVKQLLEGIYDVVGLADIGCTEDIPETSDTIEGNSRLKAEYVYNNYQIACFADDTGLEVDALNGEPGVYSAMYAGEYHDSLANMNLLLHNLNGIDERSANFKTVITLIKNDNLHQFEGKVFGRIGLEPKGEKGFGYDPIFIPKGFDRTFAEMSAEEKNKISHRGIAVSKLVAHLKSPK